MNKIIYGSSTFTDKDIISASVILTNAMVAESLAADEFRFTVHADDGGYLKTVLDELYLTLNAEGYKILGNRPGDIVYGAEVEYYKDDEPQGKFYVESGARIGRDLYEFHCVSAVGLLIRIPHEGGVYEGINTTVGDLTRDIFGRINFVEGVDYTIDNEVDVLPVNGWLPYSNCRDNLRQILFAVGASIVKSDDGNYITIKFISSPTLVNIPDERIYMDGEVKYLSQASRVEVYEHEYHEYASDEVVTLFDNVDKDAVTNELVVFKEPCHSFTTTGTLTYSRIGANFAVLNGEGTLSGKKHTHTTKVVTEMVSGNDQDNVVEVKDATLISGINSYNATKRVAEYYKQAAEVSCGIALAQDGLKPSSKVAFTNPFGEPAFGYIKSMDIVVSGINKATAVIATDWTPKYFGNSFVESLLVESGNSWVSPKTGRAKFVLIGAGQGGTGGHNGIGGNAGAFASSFSVSPRDQMQHGAGGQGGAAGAGGQQGKVLIIEADVVEGQSYSISIGQGGDGGARNGGVGLSGGNTTITIGGITYSSGDGELLDNGYVDTFSGKVYAVRGWNGIAGQDALQSGTGKNNASPVNVQVQVSPDTFRTFQIKAGAPSPTTYADMSPDAVAYGGCGGGGAFAYPNVSGGNASNPLASGSWVYGGWGGAGANAINLKEYADLPSSGLTLNLPAGTGGIGGNGGGGGGSGGDANQSYFLPGSYAAVGYGGIGGQGSTGVKGANGGILIYL